MIASINRRDVNRWMLSAAIGGIAKSKLHPSSAALGSAPSMSDFGPVRSRIQAAIAQGDATGVAVAVVHGGGIVWEEGFGWANREAGLKATPHTPFGMASITKPFTTTTLMTLVAEGKLSLDDSANKYLAGCKIGGTNGNADNATVRLLGSHASGLPGIFELYDAGEAALIPTSNALIQAYGRLAYPPATCYEYSNIGFAVLNAIASGLTQTEFGALMHQRVIVPLGLKDTFLGTDTNRLPSGAARYDAHGRLIPHYTTSTPASGELYASAHDLARFAIFNMGHRSPGMARILSSRWMDELHRPVFTGPNGVATTFGWFKGHTSSGVPFFVKTGGDPGVANRMCVVPSKDRACVAVTNRSNGWELACNVCDDVITSYLSDWQRPEEDCGFPSKPFVATPSFRGRWHGFLEGDGIKMPVQLNIESEASAALAIGTNREEAITPIQAQGGAFTGASTGEISSPDVIRTGARTLKVKLIPYKGRLVGRISAIVGDPNIKNASLPYVLTLRRS